MRGHTVSAPPEREGRLMCSMIDMTWKENPPRYLEYSSQFEQILEDS